MENYRSFNFVDNKEIAHSIFFVGKIENDFYKLNVDGNEKDYYAKTINGIGKFIRLVINETEVILDISLDDTNVSLIVNKLYVESGEAFNINLEFLGEADTLTEQVITNQMSYENKTILSIAGFTVVNIIFGWLSLGVSFPYSLYVPNFLVAVNFDNILVMGLGIVFILVFFGLYLWSKKSVIPVIIALVLYVIDTIAMGVIVIVMNQYIEGFAVNHVLDAILHALAIYSLVKAVMLGLKYRNQLNN